jgi:hypothetical protein
MERNVDELTREKCDGFLAISLQWSEALERELASSEGFNMPMQSVEYRGVLRPSARSAHKQLLLGSVIFDVHCAVRSGAQ